MTAATTRSHRGRSNRNAPGAASPALEQVAAKRRASPGEPSFYHIFAHAEALGCFGGAQTLDFAKHERFAVGITILFIRPSLGAFVASAWLLLVAGNLALGGHFDIAVRDVVLAVAAFALAELSASEESESVEAHAMVVGA